MEQKSKPFQVKWLARADLHTFKSMIHMFSAVFEEEPSLGSDAHLIKLLQSTSFLAIAAVSEHEVLGGLTAYELPMVYADGSEMILYDMAVRPEHQRMGVGKALLQSLKEYCLKHKIETFFVMAHEEDLHALEFYHATGGKSEKVVNFLYDTNQT
jgi:aminoglycoside 3-N-acetyltransferase I